MRLLHRQIDMRRAASRPREQKTVLGTNVVKVKKKETHEYKTKWPSDAGGSHRRRENISRILRQKESGGIMTL